jgi:hypothetical protein
VIEVVGYADDDDVFGEEEHGLDGERCLIMQEVLPPAIGDKLRHDNGDDVVAIAMGELLNVLTDWAYE